MTLTNTSKRKPSGAPSVKVLLSVASVAATLGGWVAFSTPTPTLSDTSSLQSLEASLNLPPIPTIQPRPAGQQSPIQTGNQPAVPKTNLSSLRTVQAQPPAPITITRSSR